MKLLRELITEAKRPKRTKVGQHPASSRGKPEKEKAAHRKRVAKHFESGIKNAGFRAGFIRFVRDRQFGAPSDHNDKHMMYRFSVDVAPENQDKTFRNTTEVKKFRKDITGWLKGTKVNAGPDYGDIEVLVPLKVVDDTKLD